MARQEGARHLSPGQEADRAYLFANGLAWGRIGGPVRCLVSSKSRSVVKQWIPLLPIAGRPTAKNEAAVNAHLKAQKTGLAS